MTGDVGSMAISPDARYVAYVSYTRKRPELYLLNNLSWSGDGKSIAALAGNDQEPDGGSWSSRSSDVVLLSEAR
jgi:hypothetical protein